MKTLLCSLLVIGLFQGEAEGNFRQVKGAVHVHTNFSTGSLSLEELAEEAQLKGIDTVIFAENFLLRFEYGLFPFRGLLKRVVEKPSVVRGGIGRWLQSVETAQAKFPTVILIPGVEVVPHYYWTGSLFGRDLTLHDTQKNMLAVGLDKAEDYLRIPAIGNRRVLSLQWPHLLKSALGAALVGLGIFMARAEREQKIRLKRVLVKVRKRHRIPAWLTLGFGALFLIEGLTASGFNPYRGDLGIEPYQGVIIRKFGIRGVIGKGGMGDKTLAACEACGCVYLHAIGGAAQVLAECIKKVRNVFLLEKFGSPEAIWELEVEDFPAVVTMDARGQSLHKEVFAASQAELAKRL